MSKRNCPNCGAPMTPNDKCDYCGTYFFDIAHIPLNEDFYLSLNIGTEKRPHIITSKVCTSGCTLTREPLYSSSVRDMNGQLMLLKAPDVIRYDLSFMSIGGVHEKYSSV